MFGLNNNELDEIKFIIYQDIHNRIISLQTGIQNMTRVFIIYRLMKQIYYKKICHILNTYYNNVLKIMWLIKF